MLKSKCMDNSGEAEKNQRFIVEGMLMFLQIEYKKKVQQ
jgi:hypothetical protein